MYPRKGSCLGLGIVDLFETQQRYADKLDQIVMKNALMATHNKLIVTEASGLRHRRPPRLEMLRYDTDVPDLPEWCHGALISYAVGRERASGDGASLAAARACFEIYQAARRSMRAHRGELDVYAIENGI